MILPIVVHSAASNSSYVSRGITDMISSRLEQTGRVQVERVEDPGSATTELGKALGLGKSRGGDYLIFGAFTQFGDGASLDVHCLPLDVKSEAEAAAARRIFISSGTMGDIIPKLDEIVDRLALYTKVARAEEAQQPGAPPPAAARRRPRRPRCCAISRAGSRRSRRRCSRMARAAPCRTPQRRERRRRPSRSAIVDGPR